MTDASYDVSVLGQVFTPTETVLKMLSLSEHRTRSPWRVLEPSCGAGAFFHMIDGCVGVEIDPTHCPKGAILADFFDYAPDHAFDTIIGNPPFVRFQDILPETKAKLDISRFDERTNLYVFFIDRCIDMLRDGGELIFINPRDFLKSTSARVLNEKLMKSGTITHIEDLGDARIFDGYSPNCVIWRFVKGDMSHVTDDGRKIIINDGSVSLLRGAYPYAVSDLFDVKVGGVSGADPLFMAPSDKASPGARNFVCSKTVDTGETRTMYYADDAAQPPSALLQHKAALKARRIKTFTDANWWHWGRKSPQDDRARVYVNNKTRRTKPFFLHPEKNFDGSVLALMIRDARLDPERLRDALNAVDWDELGFVSGGRFMASQRSLLNAPLPASFGQFLRSAIAAE